MHTCDTPLVSNIVRLIHLPNFISLLISLNIFFLTAITTNCVHVTSLDGIIRLGLQSQGATAPLSIGFAETSK